jgi:ATP-dependent DNA helicase 2 subunit 2
MRSKFSRELCIGETQYIFADPSSSKAQVALSSIVQAMFVKGSMAVVRWVTADGHEPKMGICAPRTATTVDYLVFVQVLPSSPTPPSALSDLDTLLDAIR